MSKSNFSKGDEIIKQGDSGSDLFLIIRGNTSVKIEGKKVASLKAGDYFGEKGLMADETRSATIVAEEKVLAIKLSRANFEKLELKEKVTFDENR